MRKWITRISLVIGAVGLVLLLLPASEREVTAPDPVAGARYACREFIRQEMHDPRSAQWGHWAAWPARVTDDVYRVAAEFRGANVFGAVVANRLMCEMRREGDVWHLLSLEALR